MTSSVLSLFILVNIASLLASPINDSSFFQKIKHRRSINDNRVEDAPEFRCSDFFSNTCNKKDFGIINHYDLRKSINEQIELFMKPFNFLLDDYDGKGRRGIGSLKIEQQLYHSCMNLGETAVTKTPTGVKENKGEFNEEEDNVDVNHEEDDNDIDASLEEDVKKLAKEINEAMFGFDKHEETAASEEDDVDHEVLGDFEGYEIESEFKVKTAYEIVREKFNEILSVYGKKFFSDKLTWQELDQHLELYGFGRNFFNIRVATNPANPTQNIIVLEPPSIDEWNSKKLNDVMLSLFIDIQKEMYKTCDIKSEEELEIEPEDPDSESAFIKSDESTKNETDNKDNQKALPIVCRSLKELDLEETIALERNSDVIRFYNSVLKNMFDPVDVTVTESSYTLSPIKRLNAVLGYTDNTKAESKIDWSQIVIETFKRLNISLADDEIILIRNRPYFKNLRHVLTDFDDESIVHAIRSKFIAENIRYYDWKKAYSLNPVEKSTFCIKQTKLYGISNIMLYLFEEEHMKPDTFEAERILHNLIDVFHHNISKTEDIPTIQKVQFKSELKAITRHIFRDLNRTLISNIYGKLNLTGNYFLDIINYNNILKTKNLQTLRVTSLAYENMPFSINEMDNPRNRFILHAMLNFAAVRKIISQPSAEKEIYYATYGVNMASFLYSLLREEKFGFVDMTDREDFERLLPQVSYSPHTIKCFIPENIVDYGYNLAYSTITDIYGVRFAHAALLKDPDSTSDSSEKFIKAYTESQCKVRSKRKVKKVLSQIQELPSVLSCKHSENNICNKPAFRL